MTGMLLLALGLNGWASCPAAPASVVASLDGAEAAFVNMDADAFIASSSEALAGAECLSAPLLPSVVARLHRVRGLSDFVNGDEAGAKRAFAAARAIEVEWRYAEARLPRNHPVLQLYGAAATIAPASSPLPAPREGRLELDGRVALARPEAWPTLAVLVDASGVVTASAYLDPGELMFSYPVAASLPDVADAPQPRRSLPLAITSGASLLLAGGLYGAALGQERAFNDTSTFRPDPELIALQQRTNGLAYGAIGAATLALGTGIGAVLVGSW